MSADPQEDRSDRVWPGLIAVLLLLAVARLLTTALMPLMDTSEARYGDIARQMAERSDWVTPWFRDGNPFWGKPPLAFWLSAIGFKVFGFNEFGARAPHWLLGVMLAALVWWQGRRHSRRVAWHAAALLGGSALVLFLSGAVLTDMALALGNALVMIGLWRALAEPQAARAAAGGDPSAQWLIALGAIIGLLAKGPVAIVLCAMPVLAWALWAGRLRLLWRRVAWVRGSLLVAAVALPWYVLAEMRTPGFLAYFIVGEHWHRFMTSGWQGDLYGNAHAYPRGTIWLDALTAVLPWPLLLPLAWWSARRAGRPERQGDVMRQPGATREETVYLLAWALAPLFLFTFAGNVLWTYVLPSLPAAALALARWTAALPNPRRTDAALTLVLAGWIVTMAVALPTLHRNGTFERRSTAWLVTMVDQQPHAPDAPLLYVGEEMPFSLSYYSNRRARRVDSLPDLPAALRCPSSFVALPVKTAPMLVPGPGQRVTRLGASRSTALLRVDCAASP